MLSHAVPFLSCLSLWDEAMALSGKYFHSSAIFPRFDRIFQSALKHINFTKLEESSLNLQWRQLVFSRTSSVPSSSNRFKSDRQQVLFKRTSLLWHGDTVILLPVLEDVKESLASHTDNTVLENFGVARNPVRIFKHRSQKLERHPKRTSLSFLQHHTIKAYIFVPDVQLDFVVRKVLIDDLHLAHIIKTTVELIPEPLVLLGLSVLVRDIDRFRSSILATNKDVVLGVRCENRIKKAFFESTVESFLLYFEVFLCTSCRVHPAVSSSVYRYHQQALAVCR